MTHTHPTPSRLRPIALAVAFALAGAAMSPAQAIDFGDQDGFHGTVNTTVTYGVSWRVQDPDRGLIGKANLDPTTSSKTNAQQRESKGRWSVNSDDADQKWYSGDVVSNALKATVELNILYGQNWGGFFRGYGFYDWENAKRDDLSSEAKKKVGHEVRFLDAFVFHNFNINEQSGTIRLGQQVVSWGESTFIQGGINVINPVDVSKLRVAGAELKEAFLPVNMLWGSYNINDAFSVEGFYQFEFEQTEPEPAGTYFSTNDFATLGGRYVMLNFGTLPQPVMNPDLYYDVCNDKHYTHSDTGLPPAAVALGCAGAFPRAPDRYPKSSGQYGVAAHYFADWLKNTEFGFYAMNYHSRLPLISGISVTGQAPQTGRYFVEYPEDIRLFGVSFNTQLEGSGVALQGELSYRPNAPFQIDDVELLFAGLSPLNALIPAPYQRFVSQLGQYGPGQEIRGWERHKQTQFQMTATKLFGPNNFLGADQIAVVGEVGFNKTQLPDNLRFQGDGTDTGGGYDVLTGAGRNPITQVKGFPTDFSWGYRIAARADYNNAFGSAFTVSPRIAFNHDVHGITPGPGGSFIEGRKSVTLGAEATYLNNLGIDLSYTSFFGAGDLNLIGDRDFVSVAVKYSF